MVVIKNIRGYKHPLLLSTAILMASLIACSNICKIEFCDAFVNPARYNRPSLCRITKSQTENSDWTKKKTSYFVKPTVSQCRHLSATVQKQEQQQGEDEEDLQSYLDLDRYSSLHEFHQAMEHLCAQCSAFEHPRELKSGKRNSRLNHVDVLSVAALIQTMWEKSLTFSSSNENNNNNGIKWKPNHVTFSLVTKAWSKAAVSLIMEPKRGRAKTIQQKMKYAFLESEQLQSGNEIVSAVDAMNHAQDLLLKNIYDYNESSKDLLHGINVVIDGWAKMARYSNDNGDKNSASADDSHQKHQHHLSSYEAAQKAQNLFNKIFIQRKEKDETDDDDEEEEEEDKPKTIVIKPDMITYTSLIEAWASADYDKAQALTEKLVKGYVASTSKDTIVDRPTIRLANCLMHAHAKATASIMDTVMKTHSASKEDKSRKYKLQNKAMSHAKQAHSILNQWKALSEEHDIVDFRPDVTSYTTVMDAYAKCAQLETVKEAEALLEELEGLHKANPEIASLQPNTKTYTTVSTYLSSSVTYYISFLCVYSHFGQNDYK